ncbi:MAG: hypothetical protein ACE5JF_05475 [Anaerolineales bacterium]
MLKRLRDIISGGSQPQTPAAPAEPQQGAAAPTPPQPAADGEPSPLENPEEYLERVQGKINKLAEEFAAGEINRAQFQELYDHYRREQQTVKRYIEMSPESEEWKSATTEGKSVVIRQANVAKVLGYAVYDNVSGMPLNTIGEFQIEAELAIPMLSSYRAATKEIFGAGMQSTQIEGGQWLAYMPGEFTTLMTLFSTDPASDQLESLEELHLLFERANRTLLSNPPVDPEELVFPHKYFLGRHQ